MKTSEHRPTDRLIAALAAAPLAWLALFYAFVLRARLHLGRWPQPYQPDPKELDFAVHHAAILLGFIVVLMAGMACASVVLSVWIQHDRGLRSFPRRLIATSAASFVALVVWCRFDPGDFIEWFLD